MIIIFINITKYEIHQSILAKEPARPPAPGARGAPVSVRRGRLDMQLIGCILSGRMDAVFRVWLLLASSLVLCLFEFLPRAPGELRTGSAAAYLRNWGGIGAKKR